MRRAQRTPADPGLQPERTELSWRRTLLALTVASVASTRVLHPLLGGLALLVGLAGLALATALAITTRHRFARMHAWFGHRLRAAEPATTHTTALSGRTLLTLTAFLSLGCALLLAQVLVLR